MLDSAFEKVESRQTSDQQNLKGTIDWPNTKQQTIISTLLFFF